MNAHSKLCCVSRARREVERCARQGSVLHSSVVLSMGPFGQSFLVKACKKNLCLLREGANRLSFFRSSRYFVRKSFGKCRESKGGGL